LKKLIEEFKNNTDVKSGTLEIEINTLDDEDWANNWKQYFHPLIIGEKFVVKPTWEEYEPDGRYIIDIDPESSFGTGQHETTSLCLEAVETVGVEGKDVLDMGCGSGILGIGARMLGAKSVTAVDIEENSARIATENAKKNNVFDDSFKVYWGNVLDGGSFKEMILPEKKVYEIVLINIVADIVCEMLPMISKSLNGKIVYSGIISERKEKVLSALAENGFSVLEVKEKNDWVCVIADNSAH
jgi:ribosomal protein L11 methyltransferase